MNKNEHRTMSNQKEKTLKLIGKYNRRQKTRELTEIEKLEKNALMETLPKE